MKLKQITLCITVLAAFFVMSTTKTYAQDESSKNSDWGFDPYVDLNGGLGLVVNYDGLKLFNDVKTHLYLSGCINYDTKGFFRNPDDTEFIPPTSNDLELGIYRRFNYGIGIGIGQGLFFDQKNNIDLVNLFLFYKYNNEKYYENKTSTNPLILRSNLPDRYGLEQHKIIGGIYYRNILKNDAHQTREGIYGELSLENTPKFLNQFSDYTRFNTQMIGFLTLMNDDNISIFIGDRLTLDWLIGNYISMNARTSFGGFAPLGGVEMPGLGGGLRGVPAGRFDGYAKGLNNLNLRINFPTIFGSDYIPGIALFGDIGVYDDLNGQINWGRYKCSTGVGITLHVKPLIDADILIGYCYFINEQSGNFNFSIGNPF